MTVFGLSVQNKQYSNNLDCTSDVSLVARSTKLYWALHDVLRDYKYL